MLVDRVRPLAVYALMVAVGAAAFLYPFWIPSSAFVPTQDAVSRATVTSGKTATRPRDEA